MATLCPETFKKTKPMYIKQTQLSGTGTNDSGTEDGLQDLSPATNSLNPVSEDLGSESISNSDISDSPAPHDGERITGGTDSLHDLQNGDPSLLATPDASGPDVSSDSINEAGIQIIQVPFPFSFVPSYSTEHAVYGIINTEDCHRAPQHLAMFSDQEEIETTGTLTSYEKFGRLKPVFGFAAEVGGNSICAVIDGNRFVDLAKVKSVSKIFVCFLRTNTADEIVKLMAQLQFSNHNSYMSLFLIIQNLWPVFYKGQGYRSDLDDEQFDEVKPDGDGNRKLNIYQKIGKEIGLSGNAVKFIRKIGMVNPLHFKQIETTRHSLYAAYLSCKNESSGILPAPPKPKVPTFIRTATNNPPEYSTPNTTGAVPPGVDSPANAPQIPLASFVAPADDNADFIIVRGLCECCHQETNIKIPKSQLI